MDLLEIQRRVEQLLRRAPAGVPAEQMADMLELVRAGEPGIALEHFYTQLDEYRVRMPPDVVAEIEALATSMGMQLPDWFHVKGQS